MTILINLFQKITKKKNYWEYSKIMNTIDVQAEYDASNDFWTANQNYKATKGWFSCDGICQRNKGKMEDAKYRLDQIRKEGNVRMSDAKSVAGLFSEVGVGEVQGMYVELIFPSERLPTHSNSLLN